MKKILTLVLVMMTTQSIAKTYNALDTDRSLALIGEIDGSLIDGIPKIQSLADKSKDPIYLLINSPGGSVMPGMMFVDAMKSAQAKGVKFVCVSTILAASMAFIIYAQCDERYALPNTRLLFHPMAVSVSGARVKDLYVDLTHAVIEEEAIKRTLQDQLKMDTKTFEENYLAETFWQAKRLKDVSPTFLQTVTSVEGFGKFTYKYRRETFFSKRTEWGAKVREILKRLEGLE